MVSSEMAGLAEYAMFPEMDALERQSAFHKQSDYQQQCELFSQQLCYGQSTYYPSGNSEDFRGESG
jgi:hypothetical protein